MTPFALALVACCAMVCGTVYAVERLRSWRSETWAAQRAAEALIQAETANSRAQLVEMEAKALRTEVDALRASAAFRSM